MSDRWTVQQLAEMDETAWRELSNDDGPPDICHCGDSGCIRTFEYAIALRAENERLTAYIDKLATDNVTVGARNDAVSDENERFNKYCVELEGDVRRLESENEQLRALSSAQSPASPSGPSWLDRVAAGPQRIGRPLP